MSVPQVSTIETSPTAPPAIPYYHLRPVTRALMATAFAFCALSFAVAAYVLFPYIPGPFDEPLWWHINATAVTLAGLTGLAALVFARQDHLAAGERAAPRLHTWRLLAFAATGGFLGTYLLLNYLLAPGAPLWYAYSADLIATILVLLSLAACYYAPLGHWWELFYSMGLLLVLIGAYAFWFPAIDGVYGAFLFLFITAKWAKGVYMRGVPRIDTGGNLINWFIGYARLPKRAPVRQHERLYTLMLLLAVAPVAGLAALRPYFKPWDEAAIDFFPYVMLLGTTALYTAPLLTSSALLFWARKYQSLTHAERENVFVRREQLALVLFGLASYVAIAGYYTGQIIRGPIAYTTLALAGAATLLALSSRRRLILFGIVLPIAVAVSLKKLNYIGDFLLPLYVGMPTSF